MKKIIIFAFVIALAFSLLGCACARKVADAMDTIATTAPTTATVMPTTKITIPVPETNVPDPSINTDPTLGTDNAEATILPRSGILR